MGRKGYYILIGLVLVAVMLIILPQEMTLLRRDEAPAEVAEIENSPEEEAIAPENMVDIDELEEEFELDTGELEERMEAVEKQLVAAEERDKETEIEISHRETLEVSPELAEITMAVENQGEDISEVHSENAAQLNEARSLLSDEYDLEFETLAFRIRQDRDDNYIVINLIKTEITELDKLGEIIDSSVEAGINRIDSIDYDLVERAEVQSRATSQAIEEIKAKAEEITAEFGGADYRFSRIKIDDGIKAGSFSPFESGLRAETMADGTPDITPGDIEVTTEIEATVKY
ncbi:SIMPL domain-containing protein [Halarsenatibacter silvermanii]|uniref:Uncharacterized conserved protein YggE, contains kinase-interacting SIMPL domain n=1 Tax=Halarsenatibacter silvermanii TaxID=321763 RepID=A0A1G9LEI4_9FIRM|nr:SIMPL domain-containing protein [Halarsenatibacter silvermanii]SDL60276.1 Uncharacterized conserved protein YggE, contains kinase-interacting SIMPL domain [Halarsenatibacter silvermanii]